MPLPIQLYQTSTLGVALSDSLDELIHAGCIAPQLALQVLDQYDRSIAEALSTKVKTSAVMKGNLHTYRFCDDVWTFILRNASLRIGHQDIDVDRTKIVACNARQPGE